MAPTTLALQNSYRQLGPEHGRKAEKFLREAADMLHMARLTLDGPESKTTRLGVAHRLLVDAVTALSRARVYLPGVRTYAANIVTNAERDADREIDRLHEIAKQLLWQNHAVLPARTHAPLGPDDEAQLAAVVHDLGLSAKLGHAMRHKWLIASGLLGALVPVFGLALLVPAFATGAFAIVELARSNTSAPQPG